MTKSLDFHKGSDNTLFPLKSISLKYAENIPKPIKTKKLGTTTTLKQNPSMFNKTKIATVNSPAHGEITRSVHKNKRRSWQRAQFLTE